MSDRPAPAHPVRFGVITVRIAASTLLCLSLWLALQPTTATAEDAIAGDNPSLIINDWIRRGWEGGQIQPAATCSDRVFVRRVYLDLAGRVPTTDEVANFLRDGRGNKREQLVDLLLQSEDHAQHFAETFDTLLMGRADEGKYRQRSDSGWRAYLATVFRDNRPWNDVAREILLARPADPSQRGSVWFLFERNNKHQEIAEAVAPAFFGVRIECAQCHDHMSVDEILQEHYWGLVAFFNRGQNQQTKNGPRIAESAIGGFSEFADLSGTSKPNRLTFLDSATVDEARPKKDEKQQDDDSLYVASAQKHEPRVPKFSRRERFVEDVLKDHPLVARAMVNRLWAILLGRGIVHPFDEMDSVHPPSHPELLDWLAKDFAEHSFDIRRVLKGIALSEPYQLSCLRPDGVDDPATFAWYLERPLTAEQMSRSIQLVLRGSFQNDHQLVGVFRQNLKEVLPDEYVATINDALFFSNEGQFDEYINGSTGESHLLARLAAMPSHEERVSVLYETLLSRSPDAEESAAIRGYLEKRADALPNALRQVVWSMLTGAEFRLNH